MYKNDLFDSILYDSNTGVINKNVLLVLFNFGDYNIDKQISDGPSHDYDYNYAHTKTYKHCCKIYFKYDNNTNKYEILSNIIWSILVNNNNIQIPNFKNNYSTDVDELLNYEFDNIKYNDYIINVLQNTDILMDSQFLKLNYNSLPDNKSIINVISTISNAILLIISAQQIITNINSINIINDKYYNNELIINKNILIFIYNYNINMQNYNINTQNNKYTFIINISNVAYRSTMQFPILFYIIMYINSTFEYKYNYNDINQDGKVFINNNAKYYSYFIWFLIYHKNKFDIKIFNNIIINDKDTIYTIFTDLITNLEKLNLYNNVYDYIIEILHSDIFDNFISETNINHYNDIVLYLNKDPQQKLKNTTNIVLLLNKYNPKPTSNTQTGGNNKYYYKYLKYKNKYNKLKNI
jgi:hypothetical protein